MGKVVHYDDDIFYLTALIKTIRNGLTLDIDQDYYIDKTVEDLFFIDTLLLRIYASLKENIRLIERPKHLRNLLQAKRQFVDLLASILDQHLPFAEFLAAFFEKLHGAREQQSRECAEISASLSREGELVRDTDMVSQDELSELFRVDEEE